MTSPEPSRSPGASARDRLPLAPVLAVCGLGLALRLVFLFASRGVELQSDEANYVYLGLSWEHLGVYLDQHRYLWPPGYPAVLALGLGAFGAGGLFAVKALQVAASLSIGVSTMALAARLFGRRAAVVAGLGWALYLPLAAFTHLLWNETLFLALFLPSLVQVLAVLHAREHEPVAARLVVAGLCFAAALYVKEAPLYLAPLLALLLAAFAGRPAEGARRASLFLLTIAAAVLPWTLRNVEVYGRVAILGASLGENCFQGLNAEYRNFDLIPLEKERARLALAPLGTSVRTWFVEPPEAPAWERAEEVPNTVDRLAENTRRGLEFARTNPGWLVRTRIKKLADLVAPGSFFTRHLSLGNYGESRLASPAARGPLAVWALLCPILVLSLGGAGWFLALRDRAGRWLLGTVACYVVATSMLVSMSRFRLPLVPLALALAAGLLVARAERRGKLAVAGAVTFQALLLFLWWVAWPETWLELSEMIWRSAP